MLGKIRLLIFILLPVYLPGQVKSDTAFIYVKSETFDFGSIYGADGYTYAYFKIKNIGKKPLSINKIYSKIRRNSKNI